MVVVILEELGAAVAEVEVLPPDVVTVFAVVLVVSLLVVAVVAAHTCDCIVSIESREHYNRYN